MRATASQGPDRPPLQGPGGEFERRLAEKVASGRKFLAIYLTAGLPDKESYPYLVRAVARAGADVVEVGIPFSDPIMDGPVIQRASKLALDSGVTPAWALESAAGLDVEASVVVMTYYNLALRYGLDDFAGALARAGVGGAILADLPLEESAPWEEAAVRAGVAPVLLAAPNADDLRLAEVCARSRGFVYGVSLLGVTGARERLSERAKAIGDRLKRLCDLPVGVGIGISTGAQAAEVAPHCDGVIVGSAVIERVLRSSSADEGVDAAAALVRELREALDSVAGRAGSGSRTHTG